MNKKSLLDGLANYVFFVPPTALITGILSHWTLEQFFWYVCVTAPPVGFVGGVVFGRFINVWRKKFGYN
jgi:hypothetical protein